MEYSTARATQESPLVTAVTRDVAAPPGRVWAAFTKPEIAQRWMLGPPGWTMPVCEIDLREGGRYRWRWQDADGAGFGFDGSFERVEPERRLVFTQVFVPGDGAGGGDMGEPMRVDISFAEIVGGTRVVERLIFPDAATRDAALGQGMTDGMEASFAKLDGVIAG